MLTNFWDYSFDEFQTTFFTLSDRLLPRNMGNFHDEQRESNFTKILVEWKDDTKVHGSSTLRCWIFLDPEGKKKINSDSGNRKRNPLHRSFNEKTARFKRKKSNCRFSLLILKIYRFYFFSKMIPLSDSVHGNY